MLRGNYKKKAYNCLDFCNLTSQERACGSWVGRGWVAGGSLFEIVLVKNEHVGRGWVAGGGQTDDRQTDRRQTTDTNLSRSDPPSNAPRDEIGRGSPPHSDNII